MSNILKYKNKILQRLEGALDNYIELSASESIDCQDSMLFAMAALYDCSNTSKKEFMELAKFAIKISDREAGEI